MPASERMPVTVRSLSVSVPVLSEQSTSRVAASSTADNRVGNTPRRASALAPSAGVPYQVAVRAWNTGNATSTYVRAAATNSVNLGDSGAATVSLSFQ